MKQILVIFALLPLLISGCMNGVAGKGNVLTREFSFESFTGVDYGLPGKVIFEQGEQFVSVRTNENLFDYLEFKVSNGILHIDVQDHYSIMDYDELELKISIPELTKFEVKGSGDMISNKPIVAEGDLVLKINGSGDIRIRDLRCEDMNMEIDGSGEIQIDELYGDRIECNIDGSGDITLEGAAEKFEIDIDGSGDVKAQKFEVDDVDIDIKGSGSCYVWATDELRVRINGSGSVFYKGRPDVKSEVNGSGDIKRL